MTENLEEDNKPVMKLLFPEDEKEKENENNSSENKEDILFKIGNIEIDIEKKGQTNPEEKEKTEEKIENKEEINTEITVLESIDKLRNEITKQGAKGVMNLLKYFRNVDLAGSNGVDLDEFISVIHNIQRESMNKEDKTIIL